jgi:23S rRNA pseudouridine1911/1915/1917 synthase
MAHIGHPVIGDSLYGDAPDRHAAHDDTINAINTSDPSPLIERQALHAVSLAFNHPNSGEKRIFKAPLPEDISACLKRLRGA